MTNNYQQPSEWHAKRKKALTEFALQIGLFFITCAVLAILSIMAIAPEATNYPM